MGKLNWLDFPVAPKKIAELTMTLSVVSSLNPLAQARLSKREEMPNLTLSQLISPPRKPNFCLLLR